MKRILLSLLLLTSAALNSGAQPVFQTLRYNEDWSVLRDPSSHPDGASSVKFIPLTGTNAYLSLGGEGRLKYERYSNAVFNQRPADSDGFLLQRYLFHTDFHASPNFRAFGQLQSSLEDFRTGGPRPTDRDDLDFHQAFIDATLPWPPTDKATLRLGRQEFLYGSQRLIRVREAPNNRLSFDAVRILSRLGTWQVDAWISQPVEIDPGIFDDQAVRGTDFWGAYATGPLPSLAEFYGDFYYLGTSREDAPYARGSADETRHSFGTRLFGKREALDVNFEFVGQFGSFGNSDIVAWTAASDTGWTFASVATKPQLFLRADIASGDRGGGSLGTFDPLYPRGAYFNDAALIGPQNLMDLQPGVDFALTDTLKLTTICDFVWRQTLEDGIYGVSLNLQVPPGSSNARFVDTFPNVSMAWPATRNLSLNMNFVTYVFGDFVKQSFPNQSNGTYCSAAAIYRF